ncbi:hypothetical protein NM688_g8267 [Phlebia brevispora]|uniref:Uncharacterized protein n=1 Tax=Phlebia brevispora TaxID=194682 RepID=A0ACC1RV53_9APHY|nr:hypothetical protein NM688_g8267 [Phlebia brevispora]
MLSPAATPSLTQPLPKLQHPPQHQYGTRIRSNSVIKPSARLRQSTDSPAPPRRIKPVPVAKGKAVASPNTSPPPNMPDFPPPNVMLHSEDANNKVLLAIGRSFISVDNRAMTIKDLAEMTMKYGLMCQNVSAAGQAITTYIRNHLQRCEAQEDHPLLLRHVLSGTPSDDELVPALYSRTGGAHCVLQPSDKRTTNFRRGTMVWYLSRAAGAPCPFSRAGIRLCDYNENGKKGLEVNPGKERKRERDRLRRAEQCGQKRKRLLRACADKKGSDSDSSSDEQPQCKKPLTLRLPALSQIEAHTTSSSLSPEIIDLSNNGDSDTEDSMSMDSSSASSSDEEDEQSEEELQPMFEPTQVAWRPPYPCRSGSIPPNTTSPDESPELHDSQETPDRTWRSPSVALSAASPPPDSDDEDFYMNFGSEPSSSIIYGDSADDAFTDFEFGMETDTQWDSPGPMSPPAQFIDEDVIVKQEPRDVQGLLDSWEGIDGNIAGFKVMDIVARAAAAGQEHSSPKPKTEELEFDDLWKDMTGPNFDEFLSSPEDERPTFIKQEDEEDALSFTDRLSTSPSLSPMTPFTPFSAVATYFYDSPADSYVDSRRGSDYMWADAELFSPDSVKPHDFDTGVWQERKAKPDRSSEPPAERTAPPSSPAAPPDASEAAPSGECRAQSLDAPTEEGPEAKSSVQLALPSSSLAPTASPKPSTGVVPTASTSSHHVATSSEQSQLSDKDEVVVVDTLTPCVPAIWATTFEGRHQSSCGQTYSNSCLSTGISVYQMVLGSSHIFRRIDTDFVNVTPILQFLGLPLPDPDKLASAVVVSRGDPLISGTWVDLETARSLVHDESLVKVFLSDELHKKFPQALQDFHRTSQPGRSLKQFGPHFQSTAEANSNSDAKRENLHSFRVELPPRRRWAVEDHLLSVHPPFALRAAAMLASRPEDAITPETPLSPTEEEMFQTLCVDSDWDTSAPSDTVTPATEEAESRALEAPEPPLHKEREKERERPLRRSKRVASAAVLRSRTRSAKRGSRTHS